MSSTEPLVLMNEYALCKKSKINYFYLGLVLAFILFICFLSVYFKLHKTFWSYLNTSHCKSCDLVCFQYNNINNNNKNSTETFVQRIQYEELVLATENWDSNRILGRGGFGVVYKGNWRHTDVAIKRLKTEVGWITRFSNFSVSRIYYYTLKKTHSYPFFFLFFFFFFRE